jgi:cyclase
MLRPRIVPVLLMRDGGLVKTRQFVDSKYVGDPINAVRIFNEKQVDELTLYDIGATVHGNEPDFTHLRAIAAESRMPLCYGGGVKSAAHAVRLIKAGFEKVSVSSAAVDRPELIREMADAVGTQSVVLTIDVKKAGLLRQPIVHTRSGRQPERIKLLDLLANAERCGVGEIVVNSIDRDGMAQGYDLDLAKMVRCNISTPLTVLGGAGSTNHMAELIKSIGICGAAAGSMFVFTGKFRAVLISYSRP